MVAGFRFRGAGFGFRVPGSGFRVPGFRFRVEARNSGFRVSGFGFRVQTPRCAKRQRYRYAPSPPPFSGFGFGFRVEARNRGWRVEGVGFRVYPEMGEEPAMPMRSQPSSAECAAVNVCTRVCARDHGVRV
jgi:hypothetical protein